MMNRQEKLDKIAGIVEREIEIDLAHGDTDETLAEINAVLAEPTTEWIEFPKNLPSKVGQRCWVARKDGRVEIRYFQGVDRAWPGEEPLGDAFGWSITHFMEITFPEHPNPPVVEQEG